MEEYFLERFFWRFFERIFLEECYLNMNRINLFVKILVLSRFCLDGEGRKERKFRSLEVRGKLIGLRNIPTAIS